MESPRRRDAEATAQRDACRLGVATILLLLPLAVWMWLAMMLVHELGHVAAAGATGGRVVYVNVYPGQLSSTLVRPNPRPGVVLWAGLLGGWLVPAGIAAVASRAPRLVRRTLEAWAAFCLLAGGAYLAVGGVERLTDTGKLVAAGWPAPLLIAIGSTAAIGGYAWSRRVWPRLLSNLTRQPPTRLAIATAWLLLTAWIAGQWWLAWWIATGLSQRMN
ncbi:MAG: M50 family metallopeptidase [Planctomycetota bacterium]